MTQVTIGIDRAVFREYGDYRGNHETVSLK